MQTCAHCGKKISDKDALTYKDEQGNPEIICHECFKKETGVDYETFAKRRQMAKGTLFAILMCVLATIYAFIEKGALWGLLGIALTVLVYFFASKAK